MVSAAAMVERDTGVDGVGDMRGRGDMSGESTSGERSCPAGLQNVSMRDTIRRRKAYGDGGSRGQNGRDLSTCDDALMQ